MIINLDDEDEVSLVYPADELPPPAPERVRAFGDMVNQFAFRSGRRLFTTAPTTPPRLQIRSDPPPHHRPLASFEHRRDPNYGKQRPTRIYEVPTPMRRQYGYSRWTFWGLWHQMRDLGMNADAATAAAAAAVAASDGAFMGGEGADSLHGASSIGQACEAARQLFDY